MIDTTKHLTDRELIADISSRMHRDVLPADFYRRGRAVGMVAEETILQGKGVAKWAATHKKAA